MISAKLYKLASGPMTFTRNVLKLIEVACFDHRI